MTKQLKVGDKIPYIEPATRQLCEATITKIREDCSVDILYPHPILEDAMADAQSYVYIPTGDTKPPVNGVTDEQWQEIMANARDGGYAPPVTGEHDYHDGTVIKRVVKTARGS